MKTPKTLKEREYPHTFGEEIQNAQGKCPGLGLRTLWHPSHPPEHNACTQGRGLERAAGSGQSRGRLLCFLTVVLVKQVDEFEPER